MIARVLASDLIFAKTIPERVVILKLFGMMISKRPASLMPHLSLIIEGLMKSLDPNHPHVREALSTLVTLNIAELIKAYPNVTFHQETQRLAVGSHEGMLLIYDVRTGTRLMSLEGSLPGM